MNGNSAPRAQSEPNGQAATAEVTITSVTVAMDWRGALYWPEERVLVIADLHLEKGSSFAGRGVLLPPYDTAATLARLAPEGGLEAFDRVLMERWRGSRDEGH